MKKYTIAATTYLAAALILLLSGCSDNNKADSVQAAGSGSGNSRDISVKILEVIPEEYSEYGEYYGKARGFEEATVMTYTGGTVENIAVKEGDFVKKGSSLGKIDAEKAQASYDLAVLNERVARQTYERQSRFLKDGNISQLAVDQAELAWLNSKNSLLDAEKMREGAFCLSPINGLVLNKYIDLYQETMAGTPAFRVARMDRVKIDIGIPEQEIAGVKIGNPAEITFSMFPGRTWKGTLSRLSREVSPMTLTFEAEILVENKDLLLPSGVTARVNLLRQSLPEAIIIPSEAIMAKENETYVMVEADGIARKRLVVPGSSNKTHTLILGGLSGGEKLIIDGNHLVVEGSSLAVLN